MTYCQTDIGSRSGKLQIVQHAATGRHMMKILYICFGHAVTRNSFEGFHRLWLQEHKGHNINFK